MTVLDLRFRALSVRMINKYGKSITLSSVNAGTYITTSGLSINSITSVTIKSIVEDYGLHSSGSAFQEGLIKTGDKKFSIAAKGISAKPKPGDTINMDTVLWSIVRITEIWSGEEISVYECQART